MKIVPRLVTAVAAVVALVTLAPPLAAQPVDAVVQLKPGQVLRGRFEQERHLKGFQAPLKSTGRFLLVYGRGLIWRTEAPFAVTTVMSPAGLVQEVGGKETLRLAATKLPFMSKLYAMLGGALTGDWSALATTFNVARKQQAGGWSLQLTPLKPDDPNLAIKAIEVRGNRLVQEIEVLKPDGDRDRLVFLDHKIETAAPSPQETTLLEAAAKQ